MMRHKMNLKPFVRTAGNAVLAHIQADDCYGRLMLVECQWDDKPQNPALLEQPRYMAKYECAKCGKIVDSQHNKPGDQK